MFPCFTSLVAAFISGCPFRSGFSDFLKLIFENLQTFSKRISWVWLSSKRLRWLWIGTLIFLWLVTVAAVAYANKIYLFWLPLFFILAAIHIAYSSQQEVGHKPQKYKVTHLAAWGFPFLAISSISIYVDYPECTILYATSMMGFVFACWMFSKMSKSMADTGEIDAIAWLLRTSPPQDQATFFKKAGQMTGLDSIGCHYRPRLLESLMPLLTLLITSNHALEPHFSPSSEPSKQSFKNELKRGQSDSDVTVVNGQYGPSPTTCLSPIVDDDIDFIDEDPHLKNLEIYTACLARLSEFADNVGTFWCLREDAMQHPKLEEALIDKLVVLASPRYHFQVSLRSAAAKVLNNYELDMEGNPLKSPATASRSHGGNLNTVLGSVATLMSNFSWLNYRHEEQGHSTPVAVDSATSTRVEPVHLSKEIELVQREIGNSGMMC
jgi:hypothetical protein